MADYLNNHTGYSCSGTESELDYIAKISNDITTGAFKTVKHLAHTLWQWSGDVVLPFTCDEDVY